MKADKYRGIDVADLQRQVSDAQEQLFRLRFQMGMGQTEGLKKYRSLKGDRARMLTVLREKDAAEPAAAPTPAAAKSSGKKSRTVKKTAAKAPKTAAAKPAAAKKAPAKKKAAASMTKKAK